LRAADAAAFGSGCADTGTPARTIEGRYRAAPHAGRADLSGAANAREFF